MARRMVYVLLGIIALGLIVLALQSTRPGIPSIKRSSSWVESSERVVYFPPIYEELTAAQRSAGRLELLPYTPITLSSSMHEIQMQDTIQMLAKQTQILCPNWRMYGRQTDGGWPVCLHKEILPTPPCVVYSFGIQNDWSFDDEYHKQHNCTIRTFDPSMGSTPEHQHSPGVFFYPLGLSNRDYKTKKGWRMNSFKQLLSRFKEESVIIPYLKFDIETHEFDVLHNMVADGVLKNVVQLSFEIHVHRPLSKQHLTMMFNAVKALEGLGFRRWFYHHRLNGFPFQCDQSYININYLTSSIVHGV